MVRKTSQLKPVDALRKKAAWEISDFSSTTDRANWWLETLSQGPFISLEGKKLEALRQFVAEALKISYSFEELKKSGSIREAKAETALKQREEFLGVCAHDLRSPLGIIQAGLSMVLADSPNLSPIHVELLTRAKRQVGHATTLVNDLLDLTAYDQGLKPQYQFLNLHELLSEFVGDYCLQAEQKKITLHYDNPIRDWRILADPDRIRQLLQNLFTNAVQFTGAGKSIYLTATPFQGRRRTDPPYPMVILNFTDEGPGIPQKQMQKIFDRFSQIREYSRTEGRGLGLTVVKQISMLHDGNVWAESKEGKGSTFHVLLPHVVSRSGVFQTIARLESRTKPKILIVEPSEYKREFYFHPLSDWGYDTVFAKDGVEAVTLTFHHLPDLVILTEGLSKLEELEAAKVLQRDSLTSPIKIVLGVENAQQRKLDCNVPLLLLPFSRDNFSKALDS